MGVGGFVIFALGLICGVGVALYFARSDGGDAATTERSEARGADGESVDARPEASSTSIGASSVDVEELMGRSEDDASGSGVTNTADTGGDNGDGSASDEGSETGTDAMKGVATEMADADEGTAIHWLEGISGSIAGKCYLIEEATTVGRLPRNDLQLNEGDVSRVHCRFRPEGDDIVVEALDTPNGTRVNDTELSAGEPVILSDEDVVEVGKVLLMYHRSNPDEMPEVLGEESSGVGLNLGADVATVNVDTNDWRDRIAGELEAAGGDVSVAAQALGMDPEALERLADQLEID